MPKINVRNVVYSVGLLFVHISVFSKMEITRYNEARLTVHGLVDLLQCSDNFRHARIESFPVVSLTRSQHLVGTGNKFARVSDHGDMHQHKTLSRAQGVQRRQADVRRVFAPANR